MSERDERLQKKITKDQWSGDGWWNPDVAKRQALFGALAGFGVWFLLEAHLHDLLQTRETFDRIFPFDLAAFLLITPICFYVGAVLGARRRLSLELWCREHGWEFAEDSRSLGAMGFRTEHDQPGVLLHGSWPSWNLCWKKIDDRSVAIGHLDFWDGRMETDQGHRQHKTRRSVFLSMEIDTPAPAVIVHPKHTTLNQHQFDTRLEKVSFESSEFNHKWTVVSEDPRGAYDLMDQSTIEYLLTVSEHIYLEFKGGVLTFFLPGQSDLEHRTTLARIAEGFTRAVPDDLVKGITIAAD